MANYYLTKLGERLKSARRTKGLNGRQLAALIGVHFSTISRFEAGLLCPTPAVMRRLAQVLDLDADDLDAVAHPRLPGFGPYLRARYDLPAEAVAELEDHFAAVASEYLGPDWSRP